MSKTTKDKTQYKRKKAIKTLLEAPGAISFLKSIQSKGKKKSALKTPYKKPFTRDDLTFRNMDPEFKAQWIANDGHYDRSEGLDWWLEFGFPTWSAALGSMLCAQIDIKMKKIRWV